MFCVDEKTAIQALDRKDRMLPLSPGRAESHGFEYSAQFVAFLSDVVSSQAKDKEIHVICDNVSSHKTPAVQAVLGEYANVAIHYTPTTHPGSTKSKTGSLASSATSSLAACSRA